MAEAYTASLFSELRYKNYIGQGNTYFRWEHNLFHCLYAWRLDYHWVGLSRQQYSAAQRICLWALAKESCKRTGNQWDLLCGFETVVDSTKKQFGNGCNLAVQKRFEQASHIWSVYYKLYCHWAVQWQNNLCKHIPKALSTSSSLLPA